MSSSFWFIKNRIRVSPPQKSVFLTFDLNLVTLTFMSLEDEGMVVMDTDIELATAKYGNECLTYHKCIKRNLRSLTYFYII